jgi:hypothetical protein
LLPAGFRFGVSSSHCESVKELLYPHVEQDDRFYKPQYIKSHQVRGWPFAMSFLTITVRDVS